MSAATVGAVEAKSLRIARGFAAARDLYDLLASIYPRAMSIEELAARTGRKPQGGSWNTAVATLTRNGLVTRRSEGLALTTEGYGE